jgi:DNA-binding PucR family transcriptional regulator
MFLREQCSVTATGKSLFIHPNTVKMRLRRIEELLGIHLDRPDDLLDLRTAVTVDDVARGFLDSE